MELNQLYRQKKTLEAYPNINKLFTDLQDFCNKFVLPVRNANIELSKRKNTYGRIYDYSHLARIDFNNKIICDLGARDGFFGIYLTQFAKRVDISDYFQLWDTGLPGGLPDYITEKKAIDKICNSLNTIHKVNVENQDITNLIYKNNSYDIVLCTSVIEHIYPQSRNNKGQYNGDIKAIKEIARICKPGGYVLLSTDICQLDTSAFPNPKSRWYGGTYWYSEKELFDRIINSTDLELVGNYDFSFNNENNDLVHKHHDLSQCSPCVLLLRKPI